MAVLDAAQVAFRETGETGETEKRTAREPLCLTSRLAKSFAQIIDEIPKLSLAERRMLVAKIVELEPPDDGPVTWDLAEEAAQALGQDEE